MGSGAVNDRDPDEGIGATERLLAESMRADLRSMPLRSSAPLVDRAPVDPELYAAELARCRRRAARYAEIRQERAAETARLRAAAAAAAEAEEQALARHRPVRALAWLMTHEV